MQLLSKGIVHSLRALLGFLRFVMKDGDLSPVGKVIAWAIAVGLATLIALLALYVLTFILTEASHALREEYIAWTAVLGG